MTDKKTIPAIFIFLSIATMAALLWFGRQALVSLKKKESPKITTEKKIMDLGTNSQIESKATLTSRPLEIVFAKGALVQSAAQNQKLEVKMEPKATLSGVLFNFSLNLVNSGATGNSNNTQPVFSPQAKTDGRAYYTLSYNYRELEEVYADSSIRFVYLNPKNGKWENVPTENDLKNQIITAKVSHFSDFGVTAEKAQVFSPSLNAWEASLYTGSVNYSMNIELPPGRGGNQPSLTVSYSSNRANSLSHIQKGSWLGPGWDLTVPEIRFSKYAEEPNADCTNGIGSRKMGPQYSLLLAGGENSLIWVGDDTGGTYGKFVSRDGGFAVKGYYGSYLGNTIFGTACRNKIIVKWEVKNRSGSTYIFDINANTASYADRKIKNVMVPSKYMVNTVSDLANNAATGNEIRYTYQQEDSGGHHITVYPLSITYNLNGSVSSRVEFERVEKCQGMYNSTDGVNYCIPELEKDANGVILNEDEKNYEKQALYKIRIYSRYVSATDNTLYRAYRFPYANQNFYHVITGMEKYGPGGLDDLKSRFVPTKFTYDIKPTTLEMEFLLNNNNSAIVPGDNGSCSYPWAPGPQHTWDELANCAVTWNCLNDGNQNNICESQRIRIANAGFGDCKGTNSLNGTYPANSTGSCPNIAYAGAFNSNRSVFVSWNSALAPFLTEVNNNYGGHVKFTYHTYLNPSKEFRVLSNVIASKEVYDENDAADKHQFTDYTYEQDPVIDDIFPNRGGGFGRVSAIDRATGIAATTFYYPLAAKPGLSDSSDSGVNPDKDPFYGLPLRSVTHKINGSNDQIYNDSFTTYSFVPVYFPDLGIDGGSSTLTTNLLDEGAGSAVAAAVDAFTPTAGNFVNVAADANKPQFIATTTRNDSTVFTHNQNRSFYDRYGNVYKTASYTGVGNFPDITTGSDIYAERIITSSDKSWYTGSNAVMFTYGLPMTAYLYVNGGPSVPTSSGSPSSDANLRKFSYTKYITDNWYLSNYLTKLPAETYVSSEDYANFDAGTDLTKRWNWTINKYDEAGMVDNNGKYGLLTTVTKQNTTTPASGLTIPSAITATTKYGKWGIVLEKTDGNWNASTDKGSRTVTEYYNQGMPYDNILPKSAVSYNRAGTLLNKTTVTYDLNWKPIKNETQIDAAGSTVEAVVDYDCLGRLLDVYKPDPATGKVASPLPKPAVAYNYFDYSGAGCGNGGLWSGGIASPHLRTRTRFSSSTSDNEETVTDAISDGLGRNRQTIDLKTRIEGNLSGTVSETVYDNRGLKIKETVPFLIGAMDPVNPPYYLYNLPGFSCTPPGGNATCYQYDELGRATIVTDPLGNSSRTDYAGMTTTATDANNTGKTNPTQVITKTDGFGRTEWTKTTNLFDSANNVNYTAMSVPSYDLLGNVVQTSIRKDSTELYKTSTAFDNLGRKWSVNDPDLGSWKYEYDANGNIISQTDAKNQKIAFVYDALNRGIQRTYPDNSKVENIFDTDGANVMWGKKMRMSDTTGSDAFVYDKRGRILTESKIIKSAVSGAAADSTALTSFDYFESDAVKKTTYQLDGEVIDAVTNTINDVGQGVKVSGLNGTTATDYLSDQKFNRFGAATKSVLGNGTNDIKEYDSIGRLTRICAGNSTPVAAAGLDKKSNDGTVAGAETQKITESKTSSQQAGSVLATATACNGWNNFDGPANGATVFVGDTVRLNGWSWFCNAPVPYQYGWLDLHFCDANGANCTYIGAAGRAIRNDVPTGYCGTAFGDDPTRPNTTDKQTIGWQYSTWKVPPVKPGNYIIKAAAINDAAGWAAGTNRCMYWAQKNITIAYPTPTPTPTPGPSECELMTNKLMDHRYTQRDNVGNILSLTMKIPDPANPAQLIDSTLNYSYDTAYQLVGVSNPDGKLYTASYKYDPEGNMTEKKEGADTVAMGYETAVNAIQRHGPKTVNGFTYRYDANGNLLEDEERLYEWNFDNKPVKITMKKTGVVTSYVYDGDGNRVAKKVLDPASPTVTAMPSPVTLSADVNNDGVVNLADLIQVTAAFGQTGTTANDINHDGKVNAWDIAYVVNHMGVTSPTAIPQPTQSPTLPPTPTLTPAPLPTMTPSPTITPLPTATATPRPTSTATPIPTKTPTPTVTPTLPPINCGNITYTLVPPSPETANSPFTVNISRNGGYNCIGDWNYVGLLNDYSQIGVSLCYADGTNCGDGYHATIPNSGISGSAHTLRFTVDSYTCYCNATTYTVK